MGRPRAIDPQKRELICGLVSMGMSRYRAARHVGVGRVTMYRTAKRDEEFERQVREAELKKELSPLQQIRLHMPKDWRAAAWVMERQNEEWAKRLPDMVTLADMNAIFSAMIKVLLDGVKADADRTQILENFDKFFQRINKSKRCSPQVRQAIRALEQDQQEQKQAPPGRPDVAGEDVAADESVRADASDAQSGP